MLCFKFYKISALASCHCTSRLLIRRTWRYCWLRGFNPVMCVAKLCLFMYLLNGKSNYFMMLTTWFSHARSYLIIFFTSVNACLAMLIQSPTDSHEMLELLMSQKPITDIPFSPLNANAKKWSKTIKQFLGNQPTNRLSVFDIFVALVLKGLTILKNEETIFQSSLSRHLKIWNNLHWGRFLPILVFRVFAQNNSFMAR